MRRWRKFWELIFDTPGGVESVQGENLQHGIALRWDVRNRQVESAMASGTNDTGGSNAVI